MTAIKKPAWSFYAGWIVLTGLSMPLAFLFSMLILKLIALVVGDFIFVDGVRHITEDYAFVYVLVPAAGLTMGFLQYLLLARILPGVGWWVPATILGWLMGGLLNYVLMMAVSEFLSMETYFGGHWSEYAAFLLIGLSIGVFQWLVLRRLLPDAWWWILANAAGWGFFALLFVNADVLGIEAYVLSGMLRQFLAYALWMLPGCVTAVCLALLVNQGPPVVPAVK